MMVTIRPQPATRTHHNPASDGCFATVDSQPGRHVRMIVLPRHKPQEDDVRQLAASFRQNMFIPDRWSMD